MYFHNFLHHVRSQVKTWSDRLEHSFFYVIVIIIIIIPSYYFVDLILPTSTTVFDTLAFISKEELIKIISVMNKTTCTSDPFPTTFLMNCHLPAVIDIILHFVNLSIVMYVSFIVIPIIKKFGLDSEVL